MMLGTQVGIVMHLGETEVVMVNDDLSRHIKESAVK